MDARQVHHPRAVDGRERIGGGGKAWLRGIEMGERGLQKAVLHQIVARAARERRDGAFGGLRVGKDIGRIGPAIDSRAADFRQPDRLGGRLPGGWRGQFHPRDTLEMGIGPEAGQIFRAEHPGLAIDAVGDRRAVLRRAGGGVGIIPIIALACRDAARQVGAVVNRGRFERVEMGRAVAPIRERPIGVHADEIDGGRTPDHVERETHFRAAIQHMRAILGPIGGIGDFCAGAERGFHIGCERGKRVGGGVDAAGRPHARQCRQFGADQKGIDAPCPGAQNRIVKHEGAEGIFAPCGLRRAEKCRHLRTRRRRAIRRAGTPRRGIASDAPAPGIGRLRAIAAPGIGQRVAGRHVHHHEGIKDDREAAGLQIPDGGDHRRIVRRAAVGRQTVAQGYRQCRRPRLPGHAPIRADDVFGVDLHARRDLAMPGAQIVAEPCHHQRDAGEIGAQRLQRIHRREPVAGVGQLMAVFRARDAGLQLAGDRIRSIGELGRAGDDVHTPDHLGETCDGTHDLESQLRDAVAEGGERQSLEDDIAQAAIGRRDALLRDDQRIGHLRLAAGMDAQGDRGLVDFLAIGPDAADECDRAFANANCEIGVIGEIGRRGAVAALAAGAFDPAAAGDLQKPRRPDHLAADAGAAVDAGDRRAFGGGNPVQRLQARAGDALARRQGIQHPAVDIGTGKAAKRLSRQSADRAAEQAADRGARTLKQERGHGTLL